MDRNNCLFYLDDKLTETAFSDFYLMMCSATNMTPEQAAALSIPYAAQSLFGQKPLSEEEAVKRFPKNKIKDCTSLTKKAAYKKYLLQENACTMCRYSEAYRCAREREEKMVLRYIISSTAKGIIDICFPEENFLSVKKLGDDYSPGSYPVVPFNLYLFDFLYGVCKPYEDADTLISDFEPYVLKKISEKYGDEYSSQENKLREIKECIAKYIKDIFRLAPDEEAYKRELDCILATYMYIPLKKVRVTAIGAPKIKKEEASDEHNQESGKTKDEWALEKSSDADAKRIEDAFFGNRHADNNGDIPVGDKNDISGYLSKQDPPDSKETPETADIKNEHKEEIKDMDNNSDDTDVLSLCGFTISSKGTVYFCDDAETESKLDITTPVPKTPKSGETESSIESPCTIPKLSYDINKITYGTAADFDMMSFRAKVIPCERVTLDDEEGLLTYVDNRFYFIRKDRIGANILKDLMKIKVRIVTSEAVPVGALFQELKIYSNNVFGIDELLDVLGENTAGVKKYIEEYRVRNCPDADNSNDVFNLIPLYLKIYDELQKRIDADSELDTKLTVLRITNRILYKTYSLQEICYTDVPGLRRKTTYKPFEYDYLFKWDYNMKKKGVIYHLRFSDFDNEDNTALFTELSCECLSNMPKEYQMKSRFLGVWGSSIMLHTEGTLATTGDIYEAFLDRVRNRLYKKTGRPINCVVFCGLYGEQ